MDALVLPVPHTDRAPSADEAARFRVVFFRVAPAMFIGTLDQAIVAAALPTIAADLGGFAHITWLVTAYLLAATVAAPIYGRLGDAFGRKRALLAALGIFLLGSIACAAANTLPVLIGARALQGLGGGGLMTLAQALIGEAVSPRERGRFQGWFGAIFALASTLGPVAGGVLSDHFGWRSIFWVNVPLGIVAATTAAKLEGAPRGGRFLPDLAGTPLFVAATVALLLSLSLGGASSWSSPVVIVSALIAIVGFGLLWPVEKRAADPLIPPAVATLPVVWRSTLCVFLFAALLFAMIVELPIVLQLGFGVSAAASGSMLLPLTLTQVAVSTATGSRIRGRVTRRARCSSAWRLLGWASPSWPRS
jgi:MFS family permease